MFAASEVCRFGKSKWSYSNVFRSH